MRNLECSTPSGSSAFWSCIRWRWVSSTPPGRAILNGIGAKASDQLKPQIVYTEIVEEVTDQHAVILNRNREASMILPGECLLLVEMVPALFAAYAANEAEKAAPDADTGRLPDDRRIGACVCFGSARRHGACTIAHY